MDHDEEHGASTRCLFRCSTIEEHASCHDHSRSPRPTHTQLLLRIQLHASPPCGDRREVWVMLITVRLGVCAILLGMCAAAAAQTDQQLVEQAVRTELAADAADHTHWLYYEDDRTPGTDVKQWVAQSNIGDLKRVLEQNGRALSAEEQQSRIDSFI